MTETRSYPSLKPLAKAEVRKPTGKHPTGCIPKAVDDRRRFQQAFRKEKVA